MKVLEVILKAINLEIKWIPAADILGVTPRTIRRMRAAYRVPGVGGLHGRRRGRPSRRRAPYEPVEKVLCLYTDKYFDFNVKHFHEQLVKKHGLSCSYAWTKNLLQEAGYVKRQKGRGGHRRRRPRRPWFGQMLHLDGSDHEWPALRPGERYGIPAQLYTDRHSVYLSYATDEGCFPVNFQLYLPTAWVEDAERRQKAGIPGDITFRPKWRIGLKMLDQAREWSLPAQVVVADAGYGVATEFRRELQRMLIMKLGFCPCCWRPIITDDY